MKAIQKLVFTERTLGWARVWLEALNTGYICVTCLCHVL